MPAKLSFDTGGHRPWGGGLECGLPHRSKSARETVRLILATCVAEELQYLNVSGCSPGALSIRMVGTSTGQKRWLSTVSGERKTKMGKSQP